VTPIENSSRTNHKSIHSFQEMVKLMTAKAVEPARAMEAKEINPHAGYGDYDALVDRHLKNWHRCFKCDSKKHFSSDIHKEAPFSAVVRRLEATATELGKPRMCGA
jgi:hypothetical protein